MRRSRAGIVFVVLASMGLLALLGLRAPAALAQASDSCPLEATIASLQACVQHAADAGLIDNQGVTQSLLAKLDAAQAAQDRGQSDVAVQVLQAFVREVSAQSSQHIDAMHAAHMIAHTQIVIQALEASGGE